MQNIEPKLKGIDKYFITPEYNNQNKKTYLNIIENILILGVKMIQFRSKNLDEKSYNKLAISISEKCKQYNSLFIINDFKNYRKNNFCDGIQFTSENIINKDFCKINKEVLFFGSCHNKSEISLCNNGDFDLILISPVKDTSGKKGIGWNNFRTLCLTSKAPVFGLGGLNFEEDINLIKEYGGFGIASTKYFYGLGQNR